MKTLRTFYAILLAITFTLGLSVVDCDAAKTRAQSSDVQRRTAEILASFSKEKHKVKEKYGIRKELYIEIHGEPVVKNNPRDYSDRYEVSGQDFNINIQVSGDGHVEANGSETTDGAGQGMRKFSLKDGKIEGALLTAMKVYEDGQTEKFEGVFMNLKAAQGLSSDQIQRRSTTFGLGVTGVNIRTNGIVQEKLFYQLQ